MYSTEVMKKISFSDLDLSGYGFLICLKYHALKVSKKVSQIPIVFVDRKFGESKMPLYTLVENFLLVLSIRFGG